MRSKILLVSVLSACIATPGFSQVDAKGKPASSPSPSDYSKEAYVIEKLHTQVTEEADGGGSRETAAEIRILADAGVKTFAVLSFTYTSANETVDVDSVRVRKPDGTVVKTPDYNIQDMPGEVTRTAPLYSDIHEKHVAVKGLAVGDVLEYLVRYRVVKPEVPGHFWFEHSFIEDAIIKDEQLVINVPADKYVKVVSPDFKPEIKDANGRRLYLWNHSNLQLKERDPNEIPRRIPPNPSVQVTTFATWEDVGRWYGGLQKDPLEVTPAIQAKATELTKGLKTDDEKIRALYNFVSLQFHYIGLDFGIGRYQPHAADDVLGNNYGDCKDKHTLLAALLKAVGIDAWPALIHAQRKLDPNVPSPAQFNHVITVVPSGGDMIWLDTTPEVAPYRLLLLMLRDKQALVIPSNKPPMLAKTPADNPFPGVQRFTAEGKLDASGTYTAHVEQFYRGDTEVLLRIGFRQLSQSQWKDGVQRLSYGMGFGGDVSNVKVTPPEETDKPFQISYDYIRKSYSDWDNKQISPPVPPNMGVESTKDTKKPPESVLLGGLGEIVYQSKLSLPAGYSLVPPNSMDLVEPFAEYHATSKLQEGMLISSRRLVIKRVEVPLDSWESYRAFGKAVSDDESKYLPLRSDHAEDTGPSGNRRDLDQKFRDASQALQTGDRSRAQELLQQIISSDPKYPMAHLSLGYVLMTENRTTEAVAEWRKEKEDHPDDVHVYQVTANYFTILNRKDEAMQDWRKVLKLDPQNHDAALKLSELLAGDDKNTDATAVLEEAVKQSPGSATLNMALGRAYVRMGQPDKGVPYMQKAVQTEGDPKGIDPGLLNDAAYLLVVSKTHVDLAKEYAEKAVAELDTRSVEASESDDDSLILCTEFPAAWDTLGWVYFQMGDLKRAEDYVRAAWILGQNGVSGDHLAQIMEKLGKKKEAEHLYEQALAAHSMRTTSWGIPVGDPTKVYQDGQSQVLAHYEKLTGHKSAPMISISRLPNGEWTKSPADELRDARKAKVSATTSLSGTADFALVFASGKVESVRYRSGSDELKSMTGKLQAAHYMMMFPSGSGAKIVRRVELTCNPASGCSAEMLPPGLMQTRMY